MRRVILFLLLIVQSACASTGTPSTPGAAGAASDSTALPESEVPVFAAEGPCFAVARHETALFPLPAQGEGDRAGTLAAGSAAAVWVRTTDGQVGIDGGQPEAVELGVFRYLWVPARAIADRQVELHGRCETPLVILPVALDCFAIAQQEIDTARMFEWANSDFTAVTLTETKPFHMARGQFASVGAESAVQKAYAAEGMVQVWSEPYAGNIGSDYGGVPMASLAFAGDCDSLRPGGEPVPTVDLRREPIGKFSVENPSVADSTCHLAPARGLTGHVVPDASSSARIEFESGRDVQVKARTRDGWLAVDPNDGGEGLGLFRYAWVTPENLSDLEGACDALPVAWWPPEPGLCYFAADREKTLLVGQTTGTTPGGTLVAEIDLIPVLEQLPDSLFHVSGMIPGRLEMEGYVSAQGGQLFGNCGDMAVASESSAATPAGTSAVIAPETLGQIQLIHDYGNLQHQFSLATEFGALSARDFSPDGLLLALASCGLIPDYIFYPQCHDNKDTGTARPHLFILDAATEETLFSATVPELGLQDRTFIHDLEFTQDGEKLLFSEWPGRLVLLDVASGQVEFVLWEGFVGWDEIYQYVHYEQMLKIALSPDDQWVALTTGQDVKIFDLTTRALVAEMPLLIKSGYVAFSRDGSRFALSSETRGSDLIIYETAAWREFARVSCSRNCNFALSPDFSLLAMTHSDPGDGSSPSSAPMMPISILDVSTGESIQTLEAGAATYAGNSFPAMAFSPDGRLFLRFGELDTFSAWETDTWQLLGTFHTGADPLIDRVRFGADARTILLIGDPMTVLGLP